MSALTVSKEDESGRNSPGDGTHFTYGLQYYSYGYLQFAGAYEQIFLVVGSS